MYTFFILAGASVLIALDQITKWLAELYLKGNEPFVLIDGVFELHYTENPGAAFGMLSGYRTALLIITSIALIALFVVLVTGKLGRSRLVMISGTMILAGGVGNLIDRIFRHEVIDFFYFKAINFAIFNVADSFVVVGALLILFYYLFLYKEGGTALKAAGAEGAEREVDSPDGTADAGADAGDGRGEA